MDMNASTTEPSASAIQEWIVQWLASEMAIPAASIDPAQSFEALGASSLTIVSMTGALDEWLGKSIDPTIVYDHPTIAGLSAHLASGAE